MCSAVEPFYRAVESGISCKKFRIAIDILAHYHSMNYLFIFNYLGI